MRRSLTIKMRKQEILITSPAREEEEAEVIMTKGIAIKGTTITPRVEEAEEETTRRIIHIRIEKNTNHLVNVIH